MREHGVALVVADSARHWPMLEEVTADFVYARLHGDVELYASGYSPSGAGRLGRAGPRLAGRTGLDVLLYFDNDVEGLRAARRDGPAERLSTAAG